MNSRTVILVAILSFVTHAWSCEFTLKIDKPTIIGISYGAKKGIGTKNIPGPYCGVWIKDVFYPIKGSDLSIKYSSRQSSSDKNIVTLKKFFIAKSPQGESSGAMKEDIIDVSDWSNGISDEKSRVKFATGTALLDYDKYPSPPMNDGALPDNLTISKYLIGYRDGEEVNIVVYQSDDIAVIRKFHQLPLFFQWGRNLDDVYGQLPNSTKGSN